MTERAAAQLPHPADVLELDINNPEDVTAVVASLEARWGALDGVLHAIAFAPGDALGGAFMDTPVESAEIAFRTSAFSLKALTGALLPLLEQGDHPAVVGLDFDATLAWPVYDWMGVAKAALESVSRYVARDVGPKGVRVNLVAAGPLETLAAGGIPGFDGLAESWRRQAPLGWDTSDCAPVAETVLFLLAPGSRAITGEIIHVDGGFHAIGAAP
jgi:enoyl-[acyl-carrier protein] reductase I